MSLEIPYADGQLAALVHYKVANGMRPTDPSVANSAVNNARAGTDTFPTEEKNPAVALSESFKQHRQPVTIESPKAKLGPAKVAANLCTTCRREKHYGTCKKPVPIKKADFNLGMSGDDAPDGNGPSTSPHYHSATSDSSLARARDGRPADEQAATGFAGLYRGGISNAADEPGRMYGGLNKVSAARWREHIRNVDAGKLREDVQNMFSSAGAHMPLRTDVEEGSPETRESFIRELSALHKTPELEVAPRGTELWRNAMRDIKNNNFTHLETGTGQRAADRMLRDGPSGIMGPPLWENMEAASKSLRNQINETIRSNPDVNDRVLFNKTYDGIFANPAGTERTHAYAGAASDKGRGNPAVVRFSLPSSLAKVDRHTEHRIPREMFNRWARGVSVSPTTVTPPVVSRPGVRQLKLGDFMLPGSETHSSYEQRGPSVNPYEERLTKKSPPVGWGDEGSQRIDRAFDQIDGAVDTTNIGGGFGDPQPGPAALG